MFRLGYCKSPLLFFVVGIVLPLSVASEERRVAVLPHPLSPTIATRLSYLLPDLHIGEAIEEPDVVVTIHGRGERASVYLDDEGTQVDLETTGDDEFSWVTEITRRLGRFLAPDPPAREIESITVLDSFPLGSLAGSPTNARGVAVSGRDEIVVAGRDLLITLGPAFELVRPNIADGVDLTGITVDIDGRIAGVDDRNGNVLVYPPEGTSPVTVTTDHAGTPVFLDEGSLALINLSTKNGVRLSGGASSFFYPADSSGVFDAVARGPGGEIWIVNRTTRSVVVYASDGRIVDSVEMPPELHDVPIRDLAIGSDGSVALLTAERLVLLDALGRLRYTIDAITTPGGTVGVAQVGAIAYRVETGELFLLDPSAAFLHRAILSQIAKEDLPPVVEELVRIKSAVERTQVAAEIRRLQVRRIAAYERHGAHEMAAPIRRQLLFDDPFSPIAPASLVAHEGVERSNRPESVSVAPGLAFARDQIRGVLGTHQAARYGVLPRAIAAWEYYSLLPLVLDPSLPPPTRRRPSASVVRHGRARESELGALVVELLNAAGVDAALLPAANGMVSAFSTGIDAADADWLGELASASVVIEDQVWIVLDPMAIGSPFRTALADVRGVVPIRHALATVAGDSLDAPAIAATALADRYEHAIEYVCWLVRDPILSSYREAARRARGTDRLSAFNDLAVALLTTGIPGEDSLSEARLLWSDILEIDPDNVSAQTNLTLARELDDGRVLPGSLKWLRSRRSRASLPQR